MSKCPDDFVVITIDGAVATGTSSLAVELGQRLGWPALNTGHLYRGLALLIGWEDASTHDPSTITELASKVAYEFNGGAVISVNGRPVTEADLRSVSPIVATISHYPSVREHVREWQHRFAKGKHIVAEGRDLGSVVFPNAAVKIFLTCSDSERALRSSEKERRVVTAEEILERDRRDAEREASPMVVPEGAFEIDTTARSTPQVAGWLLEYMRFRPELRDLVSAT